MLFLLIISISTALCQENIIAKYPSNQRNDGWINLPYDISGIDLSYKTGFLRGDILNLTPYFDSPPFEMTEPYPASVAIRMSYSVGANVTTGKLDIQIDQNNENKTQSYEFAIYPDGDFHLYTIPLEYSGPFYKLRIYPAINTSQLYSYFIFIFNSDGPSPNQMIYIDFVTIYRNPVIEHVEGCSNNRTIVISDNNTFEDEFDDKKITGNYTRTYNCLRTGGELITIKGKYLGSENSRVLLGDYECLNIITLVADEIIQCTVPPGIGENLTVKVLNGENYDVIGNITKGFSYQHEILNLTKPLIFNINSRAVDVKWEYGSYYENLATTGYKIHYEEMEKTNECFEITKYFIEPVPNTENDRCKRLIGGDSGDIIVTNVTQTTITNLKEDTIYYLSITSISEDQVFNNITFLGDLYNHRKLGNSAVFGFESYPIYFKTLLWDINYDNFTANNTMNYGSLDERNIKGILDDIGGSGNYGLIMIGDSQIENCNDSSTCCDDYDELTKKCRYMCGKNGLIGRKSYNLTSSYDNQYGDNENIFNFLHYNGLLVGDSEIFPQEPIRQCGTTLRLTTNTSFQNGIVYYNQKVHIREGFETDFTFKIHSNSANCRSQNGINTFCRNQPGDGFTFIIQNSDNKFTKSSKRYNNLGYEGINNSIVIEFDTNYNDEDLDPYENHLSVHTNGINGNTANHTASIGFTTNIPELTQNTHHVYIKYKSQVYKFDEDIIYNDNFISNSRILEFLEGGDYTNGGTSAYFDGMGLLSIAIDNELDPLLIIPINIERTINLDNGKAYVGFTASTSPMFYETHDILDWHFRSTRYSLPFYEN